MPSVLHGLRRPIERRLKLRLAGDDPAALAERRDRRRLRWLASESGDRVLRFRALRHIAELVDPEARDLLASIVQPGGGERAPAELRCAAEGLGRLMDPAGAPLLRRLLQEDEPACVQLAAGRGLAMMGRPEDWEAVRAWCERMDGLLLPSELDCPQPTQRAPRGIAPAVWILQGLWADKDVAWWSSKASRWLAGDDQAPRVRSDVGAERIVAQAHRRALGRADLPEADFRSVVLSLASMGRDRDHELLLDLAARGGGEHDIVIWQALGLHGDPRSLDELAARLDEVSSEQPDRARSLARAAGRLGWPDLAAPLVALRARVADRDTRIEIAWAIGECGGRAGAGALVGIAGSGRERLPEAELEWIARSVLRAGRAGREAIRGALAMARPGAERDRLQGLVKLASPGP